MSSSTGTIYALDGKPLAYCKSNCGMYSALFESPDALWDKFIDGEGWVDIPYISCTCGLPSEDVYFYDPYLGYWPGRWCPRCRALTQNTDFGDASCGEHMCDKYGCQHWPKKGLPPGAEATP